MKRASLREAASFVGQMRAGWVMVSGQFNSLPPRQSYSLLAYTSFLEPNALSQSNVLLLFPVSLLQRTIDVCLSFPNSTRHSISLTRQIIRIRAPTPCLSHQMLIGYSGWVWEPENELPTDNSPLCTLHQTKEIEAEREGKWEKKRIDQSLFNVHIWTLRTLLFRWEKMVTHCLKGCY